jgi:hypothetical protein
LYRENLFKLSIAEEINIKNHDSLLVGKDACYNNVNQIYSNMLEIAFSDVPEDKLFELSELDTTDSAYCNIMYIIALYAANKKGYDNIENKIRNKCTNDLFLYLWDAWKSKKLRRE